ncbi:hypothetical protein B0H11DRAFT_2049558 [Mycena galericulata]|nr:hypothetical protein B0H11DRAFT_2049558 [Mycena galericulata]
MPDCHHRRLGFTVIRAFVLFCTSLALQAGRSGSLRASPMFRSHGRYDGWTLSLPAQVNWRPPLQTWSPHLLRVGASLP